MGLLETISSPQDLSRLTDDQMARLAEEIRSFLIESVSRMMMRQALEALDRELRSRLSSDASTGSGQGA